MTKLVPVFLRFSIGLGLAFSVCSSAQATTIALSSIPPDIIDPTISGAHHRYVVTFDGEGEATVAAQFEQTNLTTEPLKAISFTTTSAQTRILRAIQQYTVEKEEEYCKEYDRQGNCVIKDKRKVPETKYAILKPTTKFDSGDLSAKNNQLFDGTLRGELQVEIPLEAAIEPNKQSTVYVSYKANGYSIKRPLGLSKYEFETAQFNQNIDSVDVAVYVEPDLYLQGSGKGQTNYLPNLAEGIAGYTSEAPLASPFDSRFSSAIKQDVAISKQAVNLDPLETYTVKGVYATSWWRLYWLVIALAIVGLGVFGGIIWLGERAMVRKTKN